MNHWAPTASSSPSETLEDEPLLMKVKVKTSAMGKARELLRKLETSHEPGLTNAQLMLTNDDLKPGRILILFSPLFFPRQFFSASIKSHQLGFTT